MNRDGMDAVDSAQQAEIERLQKNGRLMLLILVINTFASLAQIIECFLIWSRGGAK